MGRVVETLAKDQIERGGVDLSKCFADGTLKHDQKEALLLARRTEVKLVEHVLEARFIAPLPVKLIGVIASDYDPLDERLKQ